MTCFVWILAIVLFVSTPALAAGPKDYQVTGPVLDVTDEVIVVEKGKEKWEIGRTKDTKVTGDLKKGARGTVKYKMTATSVEAKGDTKAKTEEKPKADTKKTETKPATK